MRAGRGRVAAAGVAAALGVVVPAWLAVVLLPAELHRHHRVRTVDGMVDLFRRAGFDPLSLTSARGDAIPAVFVARLPRDMKAVPEPEARKSLFVSAVLPLVLRANGRLLQDRRRLLRLHGARRAGRALTDADRRWLRKMARRYGTRPLDTAALLPRVDIVPARLAVAQAAQESGWGTSRFALRANALFGQRGLGGRGSIDAREAEGVSLKSHGTLYASVRSYMHNLNTHRAYRRFRDVRAWMRARSTPVNGLTLAETLVPYSREGSLYVKRLRKVMRLPEVVFARNARLFSPDG